MYGFRVTSAALSITVDRVSPVPLYAQVSAQIEHAIESGALEPGFKLENEIALAEQLGLSRPTMRRAIQDLVGKGLLVRKRGVGTQVVHGRVRREVKLTSLYDDLSKAGKVPGTKVLTNVVQPAPAPVAEELHIPAGDHVLHLERLRLAGEEPLALVLGADGKPVDLRLFGKPRTLKNRRMGVALARADTIEEAVGLARAAAARVRIRYDV